MKPHEVKRLLAKNENMTMSDIDKLLWHGVSWQEISRRTNIRITELKEDYEMRNKALGI